MEMLNQHHLTGWPNTAKCFIQQCWMVLNGNVESKSFNRVAERVQHVVSIQLC